MLFSSDDSPFGLRVPRTTASRCEIESLFVGRARLGRDGVLRLRRRARTRRPLPPVAMASAALAVDLEVLAAERPVPRRLDDPLRLRVLDQDRRLVVHLRIDVGLDGAASWR